MSTTQTPPKRGLGRGLDSLLPRSAPPPAAVPAIAPEPPPGEAVREIPLEAIERNPYQPRHQFEEAALKELAASIVASGVVQPVLVRNIDGGRYQLIAGERRLRASQLAGKTAIPAIVRQVSNEQAMEMTIIENLQRQDLNPMEQARAFERLSREFGLTQEQMAQKTGVDRASIANYVRLLRLPLMVQQHIEQARVTFGHAKVLLTLGSAEQVEKTAERIVKDGLSVRQTEELCFALNHPPEPATAKQVYVDPNIREAQRELERILGVRVTIKDRKGKGKIILEYKNLEDYDRVVEMLGKRR